MQAQAEEMFKSTFERETSKVSDEVKDQITILKASFANTFNSLSDIMVEEFEAIRNEFQSHSMTQCCPLQRTVEHLTLVWNKFEQDNSQLAKRQQIVESEFRQFSYPKDYDSEIELIKGQIFTNKEDYKWLYDQISDIIEAVNKDINSVKHDYMVNSQNINEIKSSVCDMNQSMKLSSKKHLIEI